MDVYKLRVKLGEDEFEAEGSQDYVEKQLDLFLARIDKPRSGTEHKEKPADLKKDPIGNPDSKPPVNSNAPISVDAMKKIVHQNENNENIITLTTMPGGDNAEGDALLLLLMGHKVLRNEDLIRAGDLISGMKQSGFPSVNLITRVVDSIDGSFISSVGNKKGKKYRLLNPGMASAKGLAEKLIRTVS